MNIKAQGLLNAAAWIRQTRGEAALQEVLERCPPAVRARHAEALPLEWHPAEEFETFLQAAESALGGMHGELAKELGAAGARKNMGGFMRRIAFYIMRRDYALSRVASMWRQFNDAGTMTITELDEAGCVVEVEGHDPPGRLYCCTLTGWCEVLAERVGAQEPRAHYERSVLRGDPVCAWRVRWNLEG
ncbi:MAG: hypothetical protein AAF411_25335 [Myxococcota bacterium]